MGNPFDEIGDAVGLDGSAWNPYDDYRKSQRHKIESATQAAMPGPEEIALSNSLQALVMQAAKDRASTRNLILAEMGLKAVPGPDGKPTIVQLSNEERRAMMNPIEQNRSLASQRYAERAKAAFEGTTEIPAFLQKEFDSQKSSEDEVRKQLLGEHADNAAAHQALNELKKREKNTRFKLQQQDKLGAFAASRGLSGLNDADKSSRIAGYGGLVNYMAPTIASGAGLLNYLQQKRTGTMDARLSELSLDNQMLGQGLGALGTAAGFAALKNRGGTESTLPDGSLPYGNPADDMFLNNRP